MNKHITTILATIALVLVATFTNVNQAQAACHSVYGGGEVCDEYDIDLDKVVWNPSEDKWQDNIDSSTYLFKDGQEVKFELRVKNTGDRKIHEITLRDIFPSYLNWTSGGSWLSDSQKSEFKIYDLEAGSTVTKTVYAKFVGKDDLPSGITCVTNKGEVYTKHDGSDTDTSTICVSREAKVLGVTTLPATGPNVPVILVAELAALTGLGFAYLKVAKK
ncbi:hypothetical protein GYA49_06305 [Candidatus Beckwithbacteria bacterium]|nr:hypothetical protein [Candidatus Beckwithbacteria bacterium]